MRSSATPAGPTSVWIELTSKCPLACVFCSRANLRGEGEHMDASLLDSILGSLAGASVIRLNYSGESANYPGLIEAIARIKTATGAQLEIVTSLVSMPVETVARLAGSGIDRISISVHSLKEEIFPVVYGGGALPAFSRRLDVLLDSVRRESRPPAVDFAMVAMVSNLRELPAIAALASKSGAPLLSIHPVIRRPGVPAGFDRESDESGKLTASFGATLETAVRSAAEAHPALRVSVARPPDARPVRGPFTCEQNPFETVHILSNGDVVACEVLDRSSLGSLRSTTLDEIWTGPAYGRFREDYENDRIPQCSACIFRAPALQVGDVRTGWGWFAPDAEGTVWARAVSSFQCSGGERDLLVLTGLLPGSPDGNRMEFLRDLELVATVENPSGDALEFRVELPLDGSVPVNRFTARVACPYSPWRRGINHDYRELGFALFSASLMAQAAKPAPHLKTRRPCHTLGQRAVECLFKALEMAPRAVLTRRPPRELPPCEDSLSVIIPERGCSSVIAPCLAALEKALAPLTIPTEVLILVNGSPAEDYTELQRLWPDFRFAFVPQPLGFNGAIRTALSKVRTGWTYLLNSDMTLTADALSNILRDRGPWVFSLASRIHMGSEAGARETNRTVIEMIGGLANLRELGGDTDGPIEHHYSGGGSSLFQTAWLRKFVGQTSCYDPFYWEDAEWGMRARALGLKNLFVPDSTVEHLGRATINRFYSPAEVSRIFERNRLQFQLRCLPGGNSPALRERLLAAPPETIRELLQPGRIASMFHARATIADI